MIKVLYIEDNDDDVYMLKMRLELLGDFKILVAQNGEKGCEMAVSERPDVIIMDLEMPILDGWEATRRLKSNPQTRDIPVIVMTAKVETLYRRMSEDLGVAHHFTKPFPTDALVSEARTILHEG